MKAFALSVEFGPPHSENGWRALGTAVANYAALNPLRMSVIFGKGETTIDDTFETMLAIYGELSEIRKEHIPIAAHITCALSYEQLESAADLLWRNGFKDALALHGDFPPGVTSWPENHPDSAVGVAKALRRQHPFNISVAGNPNSYDQKAMDALKSKVEEAEAEGIISNYNYDADTQLRFNEAVRAARIQGVKGDVRLANGVMPIYSWQTAKKLAAEHRVLIPDIVKERFVAADERRDVPAEGQKFFGEEAGRLIAGGFDELYVYSLNQSRRVTAVLQNIENPQTETPVAQALRIPRPPRLVARMPLLG